MAFLPMEHRRQLVASHGNGFRLFEPFLRPSHFAAGCHALRPLGSIKAPFFVVCVGYDVGTIVRMTRRD